MRPAGLLALAFGMLSGKYENGARPAKARLTEYSRFSRYFNPQSEAACSRYVALAANMAWTRRKWRWRL